MLLARQFSHRHTYFYPTALLDPLSSSELNVVRGGPAHRFPQRASAHGISTAASSSTAADGPTGRRREDRRGQCSHAPMSPSACIGKAMLSVGQRNSKMPCDRACARKKHVKYQLSHCPCCPSGLCNRDSLNHVASATCPDVPDVLVVFGHVVCPTDNMPSHA
jgi:hypothetical protein